MDLNDYWQENKRFVTTVAIGAAVFLIAYSLLASSYGDKIGAKQSRRLTLQGELAAALFGSADLSAARAENEALRSAVDELTPRADFQARDSFRLASGASAGSQYLRTLTEVRESLIPRANRNNLQIDPSLGMPSLSPTKDDEIERYLEALDLVDTVANLAIDAGVRRLDKIQVRLDPGLGTRAGVGAIERTRVKFQLEGPALPLARLLASTQRPPDGRALMIDDVEMISSRQKEGEARLDLTVTAARLRPPVQEEE